MDRDWIILMKIMAGVCFVIALGGLAVTPVLTLGWAVMGVLLIVHLRRESMGKHQKAKARNFREMSRTVRRDWGDVNPVTRVERDRTKYSRKTKHVSRGYQDRGC